MLACGAGRIVDLVGGVRAFAVDPGLVRTAMTELQLNAPDGKTYRTDIERLFADGINVPPSHAAAPIADGRFDPLAGRLLRGVNDRDALDAGMAGTVAGDGRAL